MSTQPARGVAACRDYRTASFKSDYSSAPAWRRPGYETTGMNEIKTFSRSLNIRPGIVLNAVRIPHLLDQSISYKVKQAPITFAFHLSGETLSRIRGQGPFDSLNIKPGTCSVSNIQNSSGSYRILPNTPFSYIGIDLDPGLLCSYLEQETARVHPQIERVLKESDGLNLFANQRISKELYSAATRLLACAMDTPEKRLYLESKTLEVIALQIQLFYARDQQVKPAANKDREMVYHARSILTENLENPPSISELAILAGTNEFKLKKGFKRFFGHTIYNCLRSERMKQAKCLIKDNGFNVTRAASMVGYTNVSHFIAAYKKEFGLTPGQQIKNG